MNETTKNPIDRKRRFPENLDNMQILTTIYGLVYLFVFIMTFIPFPHGNPVSDDPGFRPFNKEQIYTKLVFLPFLAGYYFMWKNRRTAGIIFLVWFVLVYLLDYWVTIMRHGPGFTRVPGLSGIVLGSPMFVLGILFIISYYRNKKKKIIS